MKKETSDRINIKLIIEYDGSKFFGWQTQFNKPTIQQTIERSLQILFHDEQIKLYGAGRTDTGVHAMGQAANFRISRDLFKKLDLHKLAFRLNAMLGQDITVKKAVKVSDDFHARYSAKKRIYRYFISTEKRSYNAEKFHFIHGEFDIKKAKDFCKAIEGIHSFKSLCKNKDDRHGFESNVYFARVRKQTGSIINFEIAANRFLHSMVRAIVGAMLAVASGKMSITEFKDKFKKGEHIRVQYVPANALILEKIIY